jgi:hypothetical protein
VTQKQGGDRKHRQPACLKVKTYDEVPTGSTVQESSSGGLAAARAGSKKRQLESSWLGERGFEKKERMM